MSDAIVEKPEPGQSRAFTRPEETPIDIRYAVAGIVLGILVALAGFLMFYLWLSSCIA